MPIHAGKAYLGKAFRVSVPKTRPSSTAVHVAENAKIPNKEAHKQTGGSEQVDYCKSCPRLEEKLY